MAEQVTVHLVDDIDGSVIDTESGETIEFTINGVDYTIDLKAKNAAKFHKKLDYYIEHATRIGGRKRTPSPAAAAPPSGADAQTKRGSEKTRAIRQWAADEGYGISDRGRIPAKIEDAYNAAH